MGVLVVFLVVVVRVVAVGVVAVAVGGVAVVGWSASDERTWVRLASCLLVLDIKKKLH